MIKFSLGAILFGVTLTPFWIAGWLLFHRRGLTPKQGPYNGYQTFVVRWQRTRVWSLMAIGAGVLLLFVLQVT